VSGGDPEQRGGLGGGTRDQGRELPVEFGDLVVQRQDALGKAAQRELCGVGRILQTTVIWAQSPAKAGLALQCLGSREVLAKLARRGEDQIAELQNRG
jgi:hypothetical protein